MKGNRFFKSSRLSIQIAYIGRRLLYSILVLLGLSLVIFVISRIMPGDPARMALGTRAPEEVVQRLRGEMHLDKPILIQYAYWLKGAVHGDFGKSLITDRPVMEDIMNVFPATLELAFYILIFMTVFGFGMGTLSARYRDTWLDNMSRIISYLGVITPPFVFALFGMIVFAYFIPILPPMGRISPDIVAPSKITGFMTIDSLIQGNFIAFFDALRHLILPTISLGLVGMAEESRIVRGSVCNNMDQDYIAAARSYGIPERIITFRDLLKPSLIPGVSILGLEFATVVANALLVELIFNWPGFARYSMNAMLGKDLNAISATVLLVGVVFIFSNIMVDLAVNLLDPRIQLIREREE
jgi:peptide/nickel transport system permease protein